MLDRPHCEAVADHREARLLAVVPGGVAVFGDPTTVGVPQEAHPESVP